MRKKIFADVEDEVMLLKSSDPKWVESSLEYFQRHPLKMLERGCLTACADLLRHRDSGIRERAADLFEYIARENVSLMRNYIPAIVKRVGREKSEDVRPTVLKTIGVVAETGCQRDRKLLQPAFHRLACMATIPNSVRIHNLISAFFQHVNERSPALTRRISGKDRVILEGQFMIPKIRRKHVRHKKPRHPPTRSSNRPQKIICPR